MTRLRGALSLLACLAVVAGLTIAVGDRTGAIPMAHDDVAIGELGIAQEFDVRVDAVRLTQQVQRDPSAAPLTTDERFVVMDVVVTSRTDTTGLREAFLVTTDGRRYAPRDEFSSTQPPLTPPGFTAAGTLVFLVPADRVAGARLHVEPDVDTFVVHDVVVRVDLALTDDTPVSADPYPLPAATIEVTP